LNNAVASASNIAFKISVHLSLYVAVGGTKVPEPTGFLEKYFLRGALNKEHNSKLKVRM